MQGNKKKNQKRIHQAQKPVELYLHCYLKFAIPKSGNSASVIDPHCGSGSSRIAADMLDLPYIGLEKDPIAFARQEVRWKEYLREKSLKAKQLRANFIY